ncbi:cell wall surface anchor family protein [Bdellovibrio bacteriovorus str. Tiberius]|uniref:Cell wall surface anchor family protein n=1 Tax=Bdellovibrio bacteriovorus str. Tiberius TaxID=1069642 RepID=K7YWG1_BDEBC|nr:cell wall surface anchor family protein [Bdellovibrio bacteriovorus str. Tiberius]
MFVTVFAGSKSWGAPDSFTYQGRILKVDGTALEYNNVSFAFSITNQSGNCTFYQEQRNGINMQGSGGVFDVPIGTGTRSFPTGPTASIQDTFKNSVALPCLAGGTYTPAENETRILKVQFHDGSGWKAITPPSEIRSVPFASFSYSSARLGDSLPTDFVLKDNLASCTVGQYLTYNGTSFACQNDAGGAGTIIDINVSAPLVKGGTASIPALSITVGTGAGSVAAGNDARFGDATKIQSVAVDATAPTANQVLKYNGTSSWVPSSLAITDVAGLSTQLTNKVDTTMFPTSCTAGQSLVFVTPANKFDCYNIQITESQITGTIAGAKIDGNISGSAAGFTGALVGDVSGTQGATVVDKIKGVEVDAIAPTAGEVLKFVGGKWTPAADTSNSGTITNVIAGTGLTGGGTSGAVILNVDGSAVTNLNPANLSAAVPVNKGGTGQTTATAGFNALSPLTTKGDIIARDATGSTRLGVGSNGQILAADNAEATGLKWITPNAGTVTTVSASAPLAVATASTTPAISITNGTVNGQTLRWNAGAWTANKLVYTDLLNVNSLSPWPSSSCTAGQAVVWISGSDSFACSSITISGSNFAAQSANTFLAGPTTGSATPTFRTIASSDLPITGATGLYSNGGNNFGVAASIGTNDNQSLTLKANNTAAMTILPGGNVGIGATNPGVKLEVASTSPTGFDVRTTGSTNNSISTGPIRIFATASGGTADTGFGAVQQFHLTNDAGVSTLAADAGAVWSSATAGNERGAYIIRTGIGGTLTEKMRIDYSGAIGIGTTNPKATMDINGSIRIAAGSCDAASAGTIQYHSATGKFQVCVGGSWVSVGSGLPVPANSQMVFQSCPTGWTEQIGAGPTGPTIQAPAGSGSAKLCQSPTTPALIPANSIIPMMACPASWTSLGFVTGGGIALGGLTVTMVACQAPAYDVGFPEGVAFVSGSGSCPGNWKPLGNVSPGSQCNGATCVVCESSSDAPSIPRLVYGGSAGPTVGGTNVFIRGGTGGSTSGAGGNILMYGGVPTDGNGGTISISATNGASTATARTGGNVTVSSGSGAQGGNAGSISMTAGNATGAGAAGPILLQTGNNAGTYAHIGMQAAGGSVGIGTTTPDSKLVVDLGSSPRDGEHSVLKLKVVGDFSAIGGGNGSSQAQIGFVGADDIGGLGTGAAMYFKHSTVADLSSIGAPSGGHYIFKGTTSPKDIVLRDGNVGLGITNPGYTLHVVGTAGLSTGTAWTNASDVRLKDIHGDYEYGLNEVLKLHTVRYSYKKDNPLGLGSDFEKTGFIAQEVKKVIPDAVKQRKDGYLELNVDPIHWAVVNAIKDLYRLWFDDTLKTKTLLEKQSRELASVKAENADLKKRLERIESRLEKLGH